MDDDQQFCLRWNNHQSTLISVFDNLLTSQTLVDCTIAAEGKFLKAHKVVLSACSPYFATLLQQQYDKHPILILKDVKYQELTAMMDYMYRGEVNISQDQLAALLKAAESLQIKGLSDNRTGAPKPEHHRGLNIPGSVGGGSSKLSSGYTLEQTKRARVGQSGMDSQDLSASREGSSSPSRRRRKVRRRSIENAMTDIHDNSNSSQMQSNQSALLQQPANLAGAGAITAAAAQIPTSSTALSTGTSVGATGATSGQGSTQQPMTTSVTKKTESVKGTSDAMKTENVQTSNIVGVDEQEIENLKGDKQNHKQKMTPSVATGKDTSDLVIEPKSEYDDDGNDETVEDLTLDDEEMGMDDLDHNAGTSQGGEGSSQGYAPWQHDRSQDELLLTTQDAQQRDPQDLSKNIGQTHKENHAPLNAIQKSNPHSILNLRKPGGLSSVKLAMNNVYKKQFSATEMTDAMFRYYKAKAPKNEQQSLKNSMVGQTSPASAETHEPSTIAAIATNGAADAIRINTTSKNLQGDEMVTVRNIKDLSMLRLKENPIFNNTTSFHPRIKFTNKLVSVTDSAEDAGENIQSKAPIAAIPTSVVVAASPQIDIKPIVDVVSGLSKKTSTPTTVIKSTPDPEAETSNLMPANAIAAALINRNYHSFQKQLRAQDILRHQQPRKQLKTANNAADDFKNDDVRVKALDTFLQRQRNVKYLNENEDMNAIENNDGDDEDDSRYNTFDDIHLLETSATQTKNNNSDSNNKSGYLSDESQKLFMAANAFRNLEYTLSDYLLPGSDGSNVNPNSTASLSENGESIYECRHCGKKYRWKSTLRRHENVECGGKEPSHQCPYCPYKSKQRGNLGVHVRKHHSDLPQLASKRRSKYSMKLDKDNSSNYNTGSDDSSSKLVIDYPK